jgi:hypothetical protein
VLGCAGAVERGLTIRDDGPPPVRKGRLAGESLSRPMHSLLALWCSCSAESGMYKFNMQRPNRDNVSVCVLRNAIIRYGAQFTFLEHDTARPWPRWSRALRRTREAIPPRPLKLILAPQPRHQDGDESLSLAKRAAVLSSPRVPL